MSKQIGLIFILVFYFQSFASATMFSPLPIEKQVEEATSALEVQFSDSQSFKNLNGQIMTEFNFKVLNSYNFSSEDLIDNKFKLTMIGGTYDGQTMMIDSAPVFRTGEKSFLLIKKVDSKNYLSNFSLGKYKILEENGKVFYLSEVFPTNPSIGKISKEKMVELMRDKWKFGMVNPGIQNLRSIASVDNEEDKISPVSTVEEFQNLTRDPAQELEKTNESVPFSFWSAIAIFIFFFAYIYFKLKKSGLNYNKN